MEDTFKYILKNIRNSKVEYKYNYLTKKFEPYIIQFKIDSEYKFVIRKDIGYFSHKLDNHWHFEIRSKKGNKIYSLYAFVDKNGNVVNTKNYPKKVLKKK